MLLGMWDMKNLLPDQVCAFTAFIQGKDEFVSLSVFPYCVEWQTDCTFVSALVSPNQSVRTFNNIIYSNAEETAFRMLPDSGKT